MKNKTDHVTFKALLRWQLQKYRKVHFTRGTITITQDLNLPTSHFCSFANA